jgi:hypothetical protein
MLYFETVGALCIYELTIFEEEKEHESKRRALVGTLQEKIR